MKSDQDIGELIFSVENRLLRPEVRRSDEKLGALLSEDFVEFGSSGKIYTKQDLFIHLPEAGERHFEIAAFQVRSLEPAVVLATYRLKESFEAAREAQYSLRSSIWRQEEDRWRMVFHQGTVVKP